MLPQMTRKIALSVWLVGSVACTAGAAQDSFVGIQQIGDHNHADVAFQGEGNILDLSQTGIAITSEIGITGSMNSGLSIQEGDHHLSSILIAGNQNSFSISQSGLAEVVAHRNSLLLRQEGSNNIARHTQIGTENVQDLAQLGNNNTADLLQDGRNNSLILQQQGDLNSATLSQYGDTAAPIEVYQTGGMAISITHIAGGS